MDQYVLEVEKALTRHKVPRYKYHPADYISGGESRLRYLNLQVPKMRQTYKEGFSFSGLDRSQVARAWDYVWHNSDCYEVMALALIWFEDRKNQDLLKSYWPMLKKWSSRVDNWAHSDVLSGIYARILEEDSRLVYPTLKKWNSSPSPWLRRLSIVSLIYYRSQRKKVLPLSKILPLVKNLITDEHYYVQKGVGWTLREAGNAYPQETYRFLERNIKSLSASAFSSSTEKLSKAQKDRLKKIRKTR